jgi:hypothetical protein
VLAQHIIISSSSTVGGSAGDESSAGDDSQRLAQQGTTANVWLSRGRQPAPGSAGDDSQRLARLDGGGARACPFPILLSTTDALTDMHGDGS